MAAPTPADIYAAIDRVRQLPAVLQAGLAEAITATRDVVDKIDLFLDRPDAPQGGLSKDDVQALLGATNSLRESRLALADAVAANRPNPTHGPGD